MPRPLLLAVLILLMSMFVRPAWAQPTPAPKAPTDVTVGLYIVQLDDPSLKDSQFNCVFWVWFKWKGDAALNPLKKFEVVGGVIEGTENEETIPSDSVNYQCAKVRARITQDFDLARFPVDQHVLQLSVEETTDGVDAIRYVPDVRNSKMQKSIALSGWVLGTPTAAASTITYDSTFGDPAEPETGTSGYSRMTLSVPVSRPGMGYPVKMFWSLYLSVFVALLAFMIKPIDLDPRFGLGVGAVFAAMASAYVISSSLPDGNQVTLADKVVMIAIGFIVASIIESIVSLRMFQAGKEHASARLDVTAFVLFLLAYAGVNAFLLYHG